MKPNLLTAAFLALMPCMTQAALTTYNFTGVFTDSSLIFQKGDILSGSYTFESTAPTFPHPDLSFNSQSLAISATLPGTGWEIDVISSILPAPFTVTGSSGLLAIGDNTAFGDRYAASLDGAGALPLGLSLNFFQIDMQDSIDSGADMLSSGSNDAFPDLSLATVAGGRFFIANPSSGCSQCAFQLTSLTASTNNAVPEPSVLALLGLGVAGLAIGKGRRTRHSIKKQEIPYRT